MVLMHLSNLNSLKSKFFMKMKFYVPTNMYFTFQSSINREGGGQSGHTFTNNAHSCSTTNKNNDRFIP